MDDAGRLPCADLGHLVFLPAAHTGLRGSGRVGRSAAGRALDHDAITLAVIAHRDSQLPAAVRRRRRVRGDHRRDARTRCTGAGLPAAGRSNQRTAHDLVALDTLSKHVTPVLGKLGAANRAEAVAQARQLGLIPDTPRPAR